MESVCRQTMGEYEVIVADGGSSDLTLEIVRSYAGKLPSLVVLSERDDGVYDAINRALPIAKGQWLLVLGSDDRLFADCTLESAKAYLESAGAPFVYGNVLMEGNSRWAKDGQIYDGEFTLEKLLHRNICQQAIFYETSLFARIGSFNAKYRICADWDFALRAFARYSVRYIPLTVSIFSGGGLSSEKRDTLFGVDRINLLVQYFGVRVVSRSFASLRWEFYRSSLASLREHRIHASIAAFSVYAALGFMEKVRQLSRRQ